MQPILASNAASLSSFYSSWESMGLVWNTAFAVARHRCRVTLLLSKHLPNTFNVFGRLVAKMFIGVNIYATNVQHFLAKGEHRVSTPTSKAGSSSGSSSSNSSASNSSNLTANGPHSGGSSSGSNNKPPASAPPLPGGAAGAPPPHFPPAGAPYLPPGAGGPPRPDIPPHALARPELPPGAAPYPPGHANYHIRPPPVSTTTNGSLHCLSGRGSTWVLYFSCYQVVRYKKYWGILTACYSVTLKRSSWLSTYLSSFKPRYLTSNYSVYLSTCLIADHFLDLN